MTFKWSYAIPLPWYHNINDFIKVSWVTIPDHENPNVRTNKFASSDTRELFLKNLKTQPNNWSYRTKDIEYNVNSLGYRSKEFSKINWEDAIVVFGCSMVAGIGVAEDETITHYLETITGRPVINMGVPGAGLDFNLYNNFLLKRNYPTPWAVVNLLSNVNRLTTFREQDIEFLGLWSENDEYWKGHMRNLHNSLVKSILDVEQTKFMWKEIKTYFASWFDDTAHYCNCEKLHFSNTARDLMHCGAADNERNARLIISKLENITS